MSRVRGFAAAVLLASLWSLPARAQDAPVPVLFRVFLTDGRTLTSFGEFARMEDRVVFSMPTRIRPEPGGFELVSIPASRVDWPRTGQYSDRVHAASYASSRGAADFAALTSDVARMLNDVSSAADPGVRLVLAEKARQSLAEWPTTHYGYKVAEVREFLGVLDGIIAELRTTVGQTRFNLSLTAPLAAPPDPPLPPPTDQQIVDEMMTVASLAEAPAEKVGLLQNVMQLLDSTMGLLLPEAWSARIRSEVLGDLKTQKHIETAYASLRTSTLAASAKAARKGDVRDLQRLRTDVEKEDARLGNRQPGDVSALLATLDAQIATVNQAKLTHEQWEKREKLYRKYRRSMNSAFSAFKNAAVGLEQVRAMTGPATDQIGKLSKKLAEGERKAARATPPDELIAAHALVRSAWELAQNAFRLRLQAVSSNIITGAQQASSAAAGALMLYQKARTDMQAIMEEPARQ